MSPPTPVVNFIRELITTTPEGKLTRTYVVNYTVGSDGPFTIQVPQEQFTAKNIKAKMDEFAAKIAELKPGQ